MRSHRRSIEWWHWRYLKWLIIFPIYTLLDRPSYIRWRHSGHIWSCEALLTEDTGLTAEPWMMPADSLASVMLTLEMSCSVDGQKSTIKLSIGSEIFNKASLQGLGKIKSRRWSQTLWSLVFVLVGDITALHLQLRQTSMCFTPGNTRSAVERQVWYVGEKFTGCFYCVLHSKARPTQKRYYTTRVVRHWLCYVIELINRIIAQEIS